MTRSLLILMLILFANIAASQDDNNSKLWSKVEKLENEGLPKSALKIVSTIEAQAKANNNSSQIIKTLLYKSKYSLLLEEDAQLKIINDFKLEIDKNNAPVKNVLQNMLAHLYWQYFQQNRHKFYNRTKTENKVDPNDFRTWDLQTLFSEIDYYFQHSLKGKLLLQNTPVNQFDAIMHKAEDSKLYRPTVFDLLSHNALSFYITKEYNITKPSYKFEIDKADYFSEAKLYATLNITSKDTSSLELHALKIYQDLIAFHIKDKSPIALTDVNIQRLKFVYDNAKLTTKNKLFETTLITEKKALKTNEVSTLYDFELATLYASQGYNYSNTKKEEERWKLKEAIAICKKGISIFPESIGAKKCNRLKTQIETPYLLIKTETFLPIQKKSKVSLAFKNIENISFSIYKLTNDDYQSFNKIYREEGRSAFIKKLSIEKGWNIKLKNEKDYQLHTSEVLLPKLSGGRYLIIGKSIDLDKNFFAYTTLQVANVALIEYNNDNKKQFQLINRNTGEPITNAKVKLHFKHGNKTKEEKTISDSKGIILLPIGKDRYYNLSIEVQHKNNVTYFDNYYLRNHHSSNEKKTINYSSFLFTDRSIYRPRQPLYFKGIIIKTEKNNSEVVANENCKVTLFNANREKIKTLALTTNKYGSIHSEFILPSNGLMGNYYITIEGDKNYRSSSYFSVEEYKRPKFETKFKPVTQTYKVNDNISVKGEALAFAGSNITNAKVVYTVKRKVNYPKWYCWTRPNIFSEPQEIAHGETITNNKGVFEINFKATPDLSVDKSGLPIFKYEITADVTDLNGETRSTNTIVNIGYHTLNATLIVDDKIDKLKKDNTITIETKNLNGEPVTSKGVVKIYKLKAPKAVLRKRPWPSPDYSLYSEDEFKTHFPNEAYSNEDKPEHWKKGALIFNKPFDTNTSKTIKLGTIKKWDSGRYIIILETKDKYNQAVKDESLIIVSKNNELIDNELFIINTSKKEYKPGEKAELTLGSFAETLFVTIAIEKAHKIIETHIVKLNNNKKTITIPINKEDIGGFSVYYSFSAFNSFENGIMNINVPYEKKNLEIETLTFRDRIKPGDNETWSFKIKGSKGNKVSAEILANMYDASLDQFKPHKWAFAPNHHPVYRAKSRRNGQRSFAITNFSVYRNHKENYHEQPQQYDQLNWFGLYLRGRNYRLRMSKRGAPIGAAPMIMDSAIEKSAGMEFDSEDTFNDAANVYEQNESEIVENITEEKDMKPEEGIQIRKNFKESAFFFPQLQTDKDGNVSFNFTAPDALTKWKLQLLAHTKTLESTTTVLETVTQKELMVIPNTPRFLREGDQIKINAKIANLSNKNLSGTATLQLFDALTGTPIDQDLSNTNNDKTFKVDAKNNTYVTWTINITDKAQAIEYKIVAKSNSFSDGEQNVLPVLNNRMLVTETIPMWVKSNETRNFTLEKLKTNNSPTLKHHKLTLEMTSNPAWYAIQALPYLMEYPSNCSEQIFSRYYANALASHVANSNPRIQNVFNQWKNTDALLSNLEKNKELKSILIQETPWLLDAKNETEQKKRIALLFDLNKMNNELEATMRKLQNNQMPSGAWPWFNGGMENRFITQHIITGFGHLNQLNVTQNDEKSSSKKNMIEKAINYLDGQFIKEYNDLTKYNAKANLDNDHLSYTQLHYLYMRSFFPKLKKSKEVKEITNYYHTQIKKYWLSRTLYSKGIMALIMHRSNEPLMASKILKSLKETSITSDELGMYWKNNTSSWHWYQAPIETQSLLIETFSEIENHTETIDNLKIWLLKNKQTNNWKTTKATTDAIYALLLQGSDWLSITDEVDVAIGGQEITPKRLENVKVEAGTGYYKTSWNASEIKPEMANVKITKKGKGIAWGGLYWQYFEDLDQITRNSQNTEMPLQLKKQLFLKSNTDKGEEITAITEGSNLQIGDLVRVRIELRSDRNMEFVHMKDMRAAGLEPINVLSRYKWQDGLGYYESTKDASTNFFFDYLPKGIYVFEYDLRVNNAGNMSNGISSIQSMYAPEFSSHSEGIRVIVND